MTLEDVLNAVLEKESALGTAALSALELRVFLVNRLLVDLEVGGLDGFLYNIAPSDPGGGDWSDLRATVMAVRSSGREDVATVLEEALKIVGGAGATGARTWDAFLAGLDPSHRLEELAELLTDSCDSLWDDLDEAASALDQNGHVDWSTKLPG